MLRSRDRARQSAGAMRAWMFGVGLIGLVGCETAELEPLGGLELDGGSVVTRVDAGVSGVDAGSRLDAGTVRDAGFLRDSGVVRDAGPPPRAFPLGTGNLLVTIDETLIEFTMAGVEVARRPTPGPDQARDFAVRGTEVYLYNGTFSPTLATLDAVTGRWTERTHPGWSTVNNISLGGLAIGEGRVFVTDMSTANSPQRGIVAFDLDGPSATRFAEDAEYEDVTLGLDGRLYGLVNDYGDVHVFDPVTFERLYALDLGHSSSSRGLAVAADGTIYMSSWSGYVERFTPAGASLGTIRLEGSLGDIDLRSDGMLAVGSRSGLVFVFPSDDFDAVPMEIAVTRFQLPFVAFVDR